MSTIKTRVRNKNDIKAHWELAENFKPLKGEIILYTDTKQMKVGDGDTLVNDLPFYPSGDVTAAGNNTFTGTNTFKDNQISIEKTSAANGPSYPGIYMNNERLLVGGGDTVSSQTIITAEKVGISTPNVYCSLEKDGVIKNGSSSDEAFSLTLPKKNGTIALKEDVSANPSDEATTVLSKIKINDVIYSIPTIGDPIVLNEGDYKTTISSGSIKFEDTDYNKSFSINYDGTITHLALNGVESRIQAPNIAGNFTWGILPLARPTEDSIAVYTNGLIPSWKKISEIGGGSGDVTAAGDNTFTGSNSFTNGISLNDPSTTPTANSITALSKDGFKYVQAAATVANTITFQTLPNDSVGKSYTIPLLETNNTFTGNNTFTKPITTTNDNGFIIAPGANASNHKASIWVDSGTLSDGDISLEMVNSGTIATEEWTTAQLQGLFTYANNTLTINV